MGILLPPALTITSLMQTAEQSSDMGLRNGKPELRPEDISTLATSSGRDEIYIRQAFDDFVTVHPDGKMRPKDFRKLMAKALPKQDVSKMEKHVFRIYDTNNDGYIDFKEYVKVFVIKAEGSQEEVFKSIFRMFDLDSDGTITKKEMNKLIKDMYVLPKEEDPNIAKRDLLAKTIFAEMDADQDGKVTAAEFIAACIGQEEFRIIALKMIDIFVWS